MLDKDAFAAFVESGDYFNREIAARFRKLLESGGSKDGMTLYREFRGQDPDKTAMLVGRGLIEKPAVEQEMSAARKADLEKQAEESDNAETTAEEAAVEPDNGWH